MVNTDKTMSDHIASSRGYLTGKDVIKHKIRDQLFKLVVVLINGNQEKYKLLIDRKTKDYLKNKNYWH